MTRRSGALEARSRQGRLGLSGEGSDLTFWEEDTQEQADFPDDSGILDGDYIEWEEEEPDPWQMEHEWGQKPERRAPGTARRTGKEPRRLARARKRRGGVVWLLALLLLVTLALAGWLAIQSLNRPEKALWGSWEIAEDLSMEALSPAREWLGSAVLGGTIDVAGHLEGVEITLILTFSEDGTWTLAVDEASCEAGRNAAYEGLAGAFRELLAVRLGAAGESGLSDEELERRVADAAGMSTAEYLLLCVPELFPAYEELQSRFGRSGTYRVEDGLLIRGEEGPESFLANGELLVLTGRGGTEVYRRVGAEGDGKDGEGESAAGGGEENGEED